MGKVLAGMTMSLDGFINNKNGDVQVINPDFDEFIASDSFKIATEQTGAIIMGNNTYNMADPFTWVNEEYEYQLPLFILAHEVPDKIPEGNEKLSVTFVTEGIERAVALAKEAAGDNMVQIIGGANTIQQALNAGVCDELQIDSMPVLVGDGLRLLENIDTERVTLERIGCEEVTSMRTSLTYKVTTRFD